MSGIFKSVKKVFKKVGKVVKKIAPYLLLAAGVYFGGAYLMSSMGGAGAAASSTLGMGKAFQGAGLMERVAGAFKVSGGVWKSFLGGMGTTAGGLKSAAAFANGTYNAMTSGAALSAGILQGTEAVVALSQGQTVAQAVTAGQSIAQEATTNAASGMNTVDAATKAVSSATDGMGYPGYASGALPSQSLPTSTPLAKPATTAVAASPVPTVTSTAVGDQSMTQPASVNANLAAQKTTAALAQPGVQTESIVPSGPITDAGISQAKTGGLLSDAIGPRPVMPQGELTAAQQLQYQGQVQDWRLANLMHQQNVLQAAQADRALTAQKWGLGIQGAGLLMSSFRPDTQEEKEYKHSKNWKPSDDMIDLDSLAPKALTA